MIKRDCFQCKYCDQVTGNATKHGVSESVLVEFPMCNCYTPRGGMAISFFSGAAQGRLATGFTPNPSDASMSKDFGNVYDIWSGYKNSTISPPSYAGPVSKYTPDDLQKKLGFNPNLGIIFMMLNARALVAPCCWYTGATPHIYSSSDFRLIDLAVAQEYAANNGDRRLFEAKIPRMSQVVGTSDAASYQYQLGDYWFEGNAIVFSDGTEYVLTEEDAYTLNALFGRNYDWTLPDCGNNQRFIYVLNQSLILPTNRLLADDIGQSGCSAIWHSHAQGSPFSPSNCSHPTCSTKYVWGHVCNGGGAYSLSDGTACPYYENPLLGNKDSSRYCKLQNMYAGDSVSAAAMLEIMWLSKGGLPWTKDEWRNTWLMPYIWTTVPYNPVWRQSKTFVDQNGNLIDGFLHYEYDVYSRKASIDPATGVVSLSPMRKLPGGSVSAFTRKQDTEMDDGMKVPDIPTIIKKIELRPAGQIRIIWPIPDLSQLNVPITDTAQYQQSLKDLKAKVYNKLIWNKDGFVTDIVGNASKGQYSTGLYCVNLSFLQGGSWLTKRLELVSKLVNLETLGADTQKLLQELWSDLCLSQIPGKDPILYHFGLLKASVQSTGLFTFPQVQLSPLDDVNDILVFGFNSSGKIGADIVKVRPIFHHAWMYQKNTKLMTSWKTVWNGRPSLFLDESSLYNINKPTSAGELSKTGNVVTLGSYCYAVGTGQFVSQYTSLLVQITKLKDQIYNINAQMKSATPQSATWVSLQSQLTYLDAQLSAAQQSFIEAETSATAQAIQRIQTDADRTVLIKQIDQRQTSVTSQLKDLNRQLTIATKSGQTDYASSLTQQITDLTTEQTALAKLKAAAQGSELPEPVDFSSDQSSSTTTYNYRDESKTASSGDADTDEGASVSSSTSSLTSQQIPRLYVPFLNGDRSKFKNIDNYQTVDMSNTGESVTLSIPEDSGVIEWDYFVVSQGYGNKDTIKPFKTYTSQSLKKSVVYSTRDEDTGNSAGEDQPKGVLINESIAKIYKCASCASTVVIVVNPEICNTTSEFMVFSMQAKLQQSYKDANGEWKTKDKVIQFAPLNYTQVNRPYPSYSYGKTLKNIGSITQNGVTHAMIEASEFVSVQEKTVTGRHPWVFFAVPIEMSVDLKDWRFYMDSNNTWYLPAIGNATVTPITIPDFDSMEVYMEYAYVGEMYDENSGEAYNWDANVTDSMKTRISFVSPKSGVMTTSFSYTSDEKIDGYTKVVVGAHTLSTIWPYARYACRDYEITYIWQDTYPGMELTDSGNMKNRTMTNYAASYVANKTRGKDQTFTMADQGDHDLGTEFQPKLTYNTRTVSNSTGGTARYKVTRQEWSSNFQSSTSTTNTNDPTSGFPSTIYKPFTPYGKSEAVNGAGAVYYPYTRSENQSIFVPRHKGYLWDFLDRWRNKATDSRYLGSLRMQASDWCIESQDKVTRIREWSRYWNYDPNRETKFYGRSKTRGPVFQLEYREYYDLPTKTVFLVPYMTGSAYGADQYYCSECNRYFAASVYTNAGTCPLCGLSKGTITQKSGWSGDCTYLVRGVSSESVTLSSSETSMTTEEAGIIADSATDQDYTTWQNSIKTQCEAWDGNGSLPSALATLQARGRIIGWLVEFQGNTPVFYDEAINQQISDQQAALKALSLKSEVDMMTGCDVYGEVKRYDLGAFQLSDKYVPGSINSYYGASDSSNSSKEYDTAKTALTAAQNTYNAALSLYNTFINYQSMIKSSPNTIVQYGGVTYRSAQWATLYPNQYQSIDAKVSSTKSELATAKAALDKAKSVMTSLGGDSAVNQARSELDAYTEEARTKVESQCNRYYEYQQTAYGYNYPWSPFDSPPLFGNLGRELFVFEVCTVGGIISWLPKPSTSVLSVPTFPAIPSWWTSRKPEGMAREMTVMLTPPTECTRAVKPLSSEPHNPFYSYLFTESPFSETIPKTEEPNDTTHSIFTNRYTPSKFRIVTKHDMYKYGQPLIRADAGRFVLSVTPTSNMATISVSKNSLAMPDTDDWITSQFSISTLLSASTSTTTATNYLDGGQVKGLALPKGSTTYVGQRYPGFTSPGNNVATNPYQHGKFFVGFKTIDGQVPSWAWPERNRDYVERGKRIIRVYAALLPPQEVSEINKSSTEMTWQNDVIEKQAMWAIPNIKCAPYAQKAAGDISTPIDDGREMSGGPELDEDTSITRTLYQQEKGYIDTSFAITVESERLGENGSIRPPLIWIEKLSNADQTSIQQNPSKDTIMVHRVTTAGVLVPVALDKKVPSLKVNGQPDYRTAFSTGTITDRSTDSYYGEANLITELKALATGYYPGFVVGQINYKTIGKVYQEKDIPSDWLKKVKVTKQKSIAGTNQHKVVAEFRLNNFSANLMGLNLRLNSWFDDLTSYLTGSSESISFEIGINGNAIPGGDSMPGVAPSFTTVLPVTEEPIKYSCDMPMMYNLVITFTWWVRVDSGKFDLGPWNGPETKKELQINQKLVTRTDTDSLGNVTTYSYYEDVEEWVIVPNYDNYCYLDKLIDNLTLYLLLPGKCAEVITVKEAKFGISKGSKSTQDGKEYNLFTDMKSDWFKPNWEEYNKETDQTSDGWWAQSGRLTDDDAAQAGVTQQWMVKAEQDMYTNLNEALSNGGTEESALGKEPASQIFPRVCVELPELPISRLKMNAWNALNNGSTPDTKDPYEWPQVSTEKSWAYGGIWTTRLAGPEWVTVDQYPTRDMIWWPALPYKTGTTILKGRYFNFDPQYKDESLVINLNKRRGVEDDPFNAYAYKYETRGFDALLHTIETVESQSAISRRSAAYSREYGVSYAEQSASKSDYNAATDFGGNLYTFNYSQVADMAGTKYNAQTADASGAVAKDYADQLAQGAADAISQAASTSNYRVVDQRSWVYLDQIDKKVDKVNWENIEEREANQKALFSEASLLNKIGSRIFFTAIIPYYEWDEILEMTGYYLHNSGSNTLITNGLDPITVETLKGKIDSSCKMEWKEWSWEEIESFTFRNEMQSRYPLKAQLQTDWQTLLIRNCGSKWVFKDSDIDGGKIWANYNEEWAAYMKRGRDAVKHGFPKIVSASCKKRSDIPIAQQELSQFSDAYGLDCQDVAQKWKSGTSFTSTVTDDGGTTFKRTDPWWRF
jgi:hypothetical protein